MIILRCYSNFISAYFLHAGNDYPILDRNPEIMLAPQGENTTFVCKFPPVNRTEDLMYGVRWLINDRVVEEVMLYNQTDPVELYLNTSYLHSHKFGTKVWTWSISFIAVHFFFLEESKLILICISQKFYKHVYQIGIWYVALCIFKLWYFKHWPK